MFGLLNRRENTRQRGLVIREIEDALHKALKPAQPHEEDLEFICNVDIESIWTLDRVKRLSKGLSWDKDGLHIKAQSEYRKILSILVWIHWNDWDDIKADFLDRNYRSDADLPFDTCEGILNNHPRSRQEFLRKQYVFIPIVLVQENRGQATAQPEYGKLYRLPFLKSKKIKSGAQGDVTKELVAAKHLLFTSGNNGPNLEDIWVARKRIERGDMHGPGPRDIRAEQDALNAFKECLGTHASIMLSLTTFTHGSYFNIISPLADLDLHDFLEGNYHDFDSRRLHFNPLYLIMEVTSLADALNFLHHRVRVRQKAIACAHLDFKPQNILVRWEPGYFVGHWLITDFGTSKIKGPSDTASALAPGDFLTHFSLTKPQRAPGPFQAPEVQPGEDRTVGRESDLWSLGCLLAVVLSFAIGGPRHVSSLGKARFGPGEQGNDYFYFKENGEYKLKPTLISFLNGLKNEQPQHTWIAEIVTTVYKLLVVPRAERLSASEAQKMLDRTCTDHEASLTHRCTWTRELQPVDDPGLHPVELNTWTLHQPQPRHRRQHTSQHPSADPHFRPVFQSFGSSHSSTQFGQSGASTSGGSVLHFSPTTSGPISPLESDASSSQGFDNSPNADITFAYLLVPEKSSKSVACGISTRVAFLSSSSVRIQNLNFINIWSTSRPRKPSEQATNVMVARDIQCAQRGFEWDMISLCGNFVVLRAKSTAEYKFFRYKCYFDPNANQEVWDEFPFRTQVNGQLIPDYITVIAGSALAVCVNIHGDTIFSLTANLCYHSSRYGLCKLEIVGQLRRACFSSDGNFIFAWTQHKLENRWYIWDAFSLVEIMNHSTSKIPAERLGGSRKPLLFPFPEYFVAFEIPNRIHVINKPPFSRQVVTLRAGVESIIAGVTCERMDSQLPALVLIQQNSAPQLRTLQLLGDVASSPPSAPENLKTGFNANMDGIAAVMDDAGPIIIFSHPNGLIERKKIAS